MSGRARPNYVVARAWSKGESKRVKMYTVARKDASPSGNRRLPSHETALPLGGAASWNGDSFKRQEQKGNRKNKVSNIKSIMNDSGNVVRSGAR